MNNNLHDATDSHPSTLTPPTLLERIAAIPSIFALFLSFRLPAPILRAIAHIGGRLVWHLGFGLRKTVMDNLRIVYGDSKSHSELKYVGRLSMRHVIASFIEFCILYRPPYRRVLEIPIKGEEHLTRALEKNRGVLAVTCHVGNLFLLTAALTRRGYPVSFVFKESSNPALKEYMRKLFVRFDVNPIYVKPRKEASQKSLDTLMNKGVLIVAMDQDTRSTAAGVEFFGVVVPTASRPVQMAMETGAQVIPLYMERHGWMKHEIMIEEPIPMLGSPDDDKAVAKNLKLVNEFIERVVLENPRDWWWVHRRWKRAGKFAAQNGTD
ncbi:MAG: hypothetical protein JW885_12890 [Deltaproteobacteria bacterium]|nr:hypothetical protein [Candidatus Zymogenaceae bacterium]